MLTKSSSALNNASLLAAVGIDTRLLSQMAGSGSLASLTSTKRSTESPVQKPKEDTQTQQQRQAAAKLALRKQLEKTLLQVNCCQTKPTLLTDFVADPTTQASSTRNAFHPQPGQHRVHLLDRLGGVCEPHPEPGRRDPAYAQTLHLLPVSHRLHTNLEVGQGSQR